jgi:hypothetical protein
MDAAVHEGCTRQAQGQQSVGAEERHLLLTELQWAVGRAAAALHAGGSTHLSCGPVISAKRQMALITYQVSDPSRCHGKPCGAGNSQAKLNSGHLDD